MDRVSASEAGDGCSNQPGSKERAGRRAIVGSAPKAHQPLAEIPRGRTKLNLNSILMGYPFRGEVQRLENQEHPEIKQLSENPNKVVREVLTPNREWLQTKIGAYREARDYFYDLRDNYGIAVPAIDFVAGENERSQKKLFVMVDKISGKNVKSETWYPLEAAEEFDFFYSQLLQSFFDAYKNKEPYWSDFHDAQIVYGKKNGDAKDRLYIVDIENMFYDPCVVTPRSWYELFKRVVVDFSNDISQVRRKFPPGTEFQKTHKKLKEIMEYLG